MAVSKQDIKEWLEEGKKQKATHVLIVCDTFSHDDYPVYIKEHQDIYSEINEYNNENMQKIMEIYNLNLDIDSQLKENRAYHIEPVIDIKFSLKEKNNKITKYQEELIKFLDIPFNDLPLHINSNDPMKRKIVKLRLKSSQ